MKMLHYLHTKTVLKCTKLAFSCGFALDPAEGAYCIPRSRVVFIWLELSQLTR